jgi:hypothetical protein
VCVCVCVCSTNLVHVLALVATVATDVKHHVTIPSGQRSVQHSGHEPLASLETLCAAIVDQPDAVVWWRVRKCIRVGG